MPEIGKYNTLSINRFVDFGAYLQADEYDEILIPQRYLPANAKVGDQLDVFIYLDSEDRLIATTEKPIAMVGDFALLKVAAINKIGAFLDWGLPKDLFVPFREQKVTMEEGKSYVVYIYLDDESKRIVASSKLDKFLHNIPVDFEVNQEVDIMIVSKTDLGYKTIINDSHWGMLYLNEVFRPIKRGERTKAFIKKIREDEKIDLYLQKEGFEKVDDLTETILNKLKQQNGFLAVTDKSSPEIISDLFHTSKKTFKKAVGSLYKKRLITIENDGIRLSA